MHGSLFQSLPSKRPIRPFHDAGPIKNPGLIRWHSAVIAVLFGLLLILLFLAASPAFSAPSAKVRGMQAATTATTLQVSSLTVNQHPITVLVATVTDPNAVMQGLVSFYDGKMLLGTGQIVNSGTKYTHGKANLKVQLCPGSHLLKAVFAGTVSDAPSTSSTQNLTVTGGVTVTTIGSSGQQGNYTLTSQVVTSGPIAAGGSVAFLDASNGSASLGAANLGPGTTTAKFANPASYGIYDTTDNSRPQQVVVADLNGDGILDFAEVDYSAAISVHLGKGDGTFLAATPFCITGNPATECQAGSEPTTIAVGDFNSDGIPDLVVNDGSNVDVFIGNGDGTFQPEVAYSTASGNYNIVVGDFNRDGTPDLAVTVSGGVSIVLGNGDGTFQPNNDISLSDSSTYLTVGDFNKDGIQDLAIDGWNGSSVMVLLGNGDGTFKAEKDTSIDINPAGANLVGADLKGQGYLCDLVIAGDDLVEPLLGNGDGTFKAGPQELSVDPGFSPYSAAFAVADLNGDGIPDLAATWYTQDTAVGRIAVFYGLGDGTFNATPIQLSAGQEPVWIATGDFDGNGSPDLITANENDGTDSVILNLSTTTASAVLTQVAVSGSGTHNVFAQYAGNTAFAASSSSTIGLTAGGTAVAPTVTSFSPSGVVAGSGAFTLTVNGTNFATGSYIKWNGSARTTAFVSATKLTAAILATDVATAGNYPITVVNSSGKASPAVMFAVTPAASVLTSISPNDMPAGSPGFTLSVNGAGFTSGTAGSILYWNSTKLPTTFASTTKLTASVPAADVATAGSASITVKTGTGAASNAFTFTVTPEMLAPIAMGFFNKDGTSGSTTGNIACTWKASSLDYWCTLTKSGFYFKTYVVNVTSADVSNPAIATVNSIGGSATDPTVGQIVVKFYNLTGAGVQEPFYICVYKP